MDINDFRGLITGLLLLSNIGLCFWAYSSKRKKGFDEAANIPFADEHMNSPQASENNDHV